MGVSLEKLIDTNKYIKLKMSRMKSKVIFNTINGYDEYMKLKYIKS